MQYLRMLLLIVVSFFPAGCDFSGEPAERLTVLAGSELKDLNPFFKDIERETGIKLQLEYIGTLDGAEKLAGGATYDLAWFSHAKYLNMLPETRQKIKAQEKIMLSPVILGIKESRAREWGWLDKNSIRWSDIAERSQQGELRFAMTNPASSNSGFTALLGVAAAFSKSVSALTSADVDKERLKQFFTGQKLTSGSSGWLAEAYTREQDDLDGLINYESVLMSLNQSGSLNEKLYLVYPEEGIVTADYPLMLLANEKRNAYQRLVAYLKSEHMQRAIMEETNRRPVIPQVKPSRSFYNGMLIELPFPSDQQTVDSLIFSYLDEVRPPSSPIFVLDVSGSMKNQRIDSLRLALNNLTGLDTTLTGKFARFRIREQINMIPFNHEVFRAATFSIDSGEANSPNMLAIRQFVDSLQADGGTAIYTALMSAYELAREQQRRNPNRYYSIVLLSDGKNESDVPYDTFENYYRRLPSEQQVIKTFTILFGNAHQDEMERVAELTGGRVFDGQQKSLANVFKQIRGYQ